MLSCTFENGGKGSLRHATVEAIVIWDKKLLLVKFSDIQAVYE